MTDTKPEALRLADWLKTSVNTKDHYAANELRRLHEENERLLAANKDSLSHFDALMADHKKLQMLNTELLEALKGLVEAYCRSHTGLTKEQRQEDHIRSLGAQKAILKAWRESK